MERVEEHAWRAIRKLSKILFAFMILGFGMLFVAQYILWWRMK